MSRVWIGLALALAFQPAMAQGTFEPNTDRQGSDYHDFDIRGGPTSCQQACAHDRQCVAWTFVHRNVQGASQRCWLKNSVPAPNYSDCCVSGVMR